MKKIVFLITMLVVVVATTKAAETNTTEQGDSNATLLQPAGSYIYYGSQVFDMKECVEFLSTRHQSAYETFQSGYKCYQAGWGLMGAGLGVNLVGSLLVAFIPEEGNEAIAMMMGLEGIVLDTCYTGKAFAGLVKRARAGEYKPEDNVLFVHSGGAGGLFAQDWENL